MSEDAVSVFRKSISSHPNGGKIIVDLNSAKDLADVFRENGFSTEIILHYRRIGRAVRREKRDVQDRNLAIKSLAEGGAGIGDLAHKFNLSATSIGKIVGPRPKVDFAARNGAIYKDYLEKMTLRKIAAKHGLSVERIRQIAAKMQRKNRE